LAGSVAVSTDLSPFADALRRQGFQVVDLPRDGLESLGHRVDAVVVSGVERGLLGAWTTQLPCPVLDADGKTPADVANEVQETLRARGGAGQA
jgi:hypothetical protein